jgi:ribosomal protein S27AE
MSGNDERKIEFPICPRCGKVPRFWREVNARKVPTYYFNSKEYLNRRPRVLIVNGALGEDINHLDEIKTIECGECGYIASSNIYKKIIMIAKHYYGLRGNDVWK